MRLPRVSTGVRRLLVAACLCSAVDVAYAQRLPVRCYAEAEGLVQGSVNVAFQDSRGFLWIGTHEGLSRFDGHAFVNYGTSDGLPHGFINGIVEDDRGRVWVATVGGLARLVDAIAPAASANGDPRAHGRQKLLGYSISPAPGANEINAIALDGRGSFWIATNGGLYRADPDASGEPHFELVKFEGNSVTAAFVDRSGRLWLGVQERGIALLDGDRTTLYDEPSEDASGSRSAVAFEQDRDGTLYVVTGSQLFTFYPQADRTTGRWIPAGVELKPGQAWLSIRFDSSGRLWIGTTEGLLLRERGTWRSISSTQGLSPGAISPLMEDRDGNLWIGTPGAACRISPAPLVSYTVAEGLPHPIVLGIFEDASGAIYVNTAGGFARITGDHRAVLLPGSDAPPFRALERRVFPSRTRDWWVVLDDELIRFRGPQLQFRHPVQRIPAASLASRRLAIPGTLRSPGLYEDAAGRLLVATSENGLYWTDPASASVVEQVVAPRSAGLPPLVPAFADRAGSIWLASMESLGRLRNGRVERVTAAAGLPETKVRSLHLDRRGRLWIGLRTGGVSVIRDPAAETLEFVNYSTRAGLASNTIWSITDDERGRIYLATNRGLDRLDPETGRVRHFTVADGLPSNYATYCLRDSRGDIWVGTINGLARLDPRAERPAPKPPPVYLTRIQLAGEELPLPETGSAAVSLDRLPSSRNQVLIEYVGVSLGREHAFRYQYRLDGVSREWSAPTDQRAITYAELPPGRFRFEVRAIDWQGNTSAQPAIVTIEILPPFWRRWWFLVTTGSFLVTTGLLLHRVRLRHALALERIRRQVATDLHDDMGSGLSQIAILSEVAKRDFRRPHLDAIAGLARGMRESMDDIVWAVDPRADRLADLVERIRQAAFNSLEAEGIEVDLRLPEPRDLDRGNLGAGMRRHLLLVAKEAITNVARHAAASRVEIVLEIARRDLRLTIRDDGRGFVTGAASEGQGLRSLSRRAGELGGRLEIESAPGLGTTIAVTVLIR